MTEDRLCEWFEELYLRYNSPAFIEKDPIVVPHQFAGRTDIETAGFFAALFAWGRRETVIAKSLALMEGMDWQPTRFLLNWQGKLPAPLERFCHRTFNAQDLHFFLSKLSIGLRQYGTLEALFLSPQGTFDSMEAALNRFYHFFFDEVPAHYTRRKHIGAPERKSACKRVNMFLRWMVRKDGKGVDFGLWDRIPTSGLIVPLDVHAERSAVKYGLLKPTNNAWADAVALTNRLKQWDADDPARFDFVLFGLGVEESRKGK